MEADLFGRQPQWEKASIKIAKNQQNMEESFNYRQPALKKVIVNILCFDCCC